MSSRSVRASAAAVVAMALLSGCAVPASPAAPAAPQSNVPASPTTTVAVTVPFSLFTHCGIYEAQVHGSFFVADQRLDDGHGNPPSGWGNPYQPGTMAVEGQRRSSTTTRATL